MTPQYTDHRYTAHQLLVILRGVIHESPSRRPCWFSPSVGLCSNFMEGCHTLNERPVLLKDAVPNLKELIGEWPLYSGDDYYPVPNPWVSDPQKAYDVRDKYDMDTQYGRNRLALLDYLIDSTRGQQLTPDGE